MSRVHAGDGVGACRDGSAALHDHLCETGTRVEDPDRLLAQQSHEYVGVRLLSSRARERGGVDADRMGGVDDEAQAGALYRREQATARGRSLARLLEGAPE